MIFWTILKRIIKKIYFPIPGHNTPAMVRPEHLSTEHNKQY